MDARDVNQYLIRGIVGNKHHDLYLNSASFHASIELMARMIPIIVDALAVSAEEEAQQMRAQMLAAMNSLGPPMWSTFEHKSAKTGERVV